MILRLLRPLTLVLLLLPIHAGTLDPRDFPAPVRVACVGDSITAGVGATEGRAYPAQLQEMLGPNWEVRNFGVSGRTLLRKGDHPYWNEGAFHEARGFAPDAVVILLGANDSKPHNWEHKGEFEGDYRDLVNVFRALPCRPRIYVCRPIPAPNGGNFGINEPTLQEEIGIIDRIAKDMQLDLIDLHAPLEGKAEMIPDRVHPNNDGAKVMARTVAVALSGSAEPAERLLQLNSLFRDHAVLPRGRPLPVWGMTSPEGEVTVEFAGQRKSARADAGGQWSVTLDPLVAQSTGRTLTATGNRALKVEDLLVGDVWLASGQSNMERRLGPQGGQKPIVGWEEAARNANLPLLREYHVPKAMATEPVADASGAWRVCTPENVEDFSAVGFFFARDLLDAIEVPVGIIHSSWGGTVAEAWTSAGALRAMPDFREAVEIVEGRVDPKDFAARWLAEHDPGSAAPGWQVGALNANGGWKAVEVPSKVQSFGLDAVTGVFWFRRDVEVPAALAGKPAVLELGQIDDEDTTWINGRQVGQETRWNADRHHPVPENVLKAGSNVVAIRMVNPVGEGGWLSDAAAIRLTIGDETLPLAGEWRARLGVDFSKTPMPVLTDRGPNRPTVLSNAMIAPLIPYPIKGVIWYQGESNNGRPEQYRRLLPTLIADWRSRWQQPDLPFFVVQIAPHRDMTPELREAQLLTVQHTPRTALAVTTDVGDAGDIHPADKGPVGKRLALAARAIAYGESTEYSGPLFREMETKGGEAVLRFDHTGGGLVARDGPLKGFTIAGKDGGFVPAEAEIRGDTVVVSSPSVADPTAVRYGWENVPDVNLFNRAGLPASPFRTDAPSE